MTTYSIKQHWQQQCYIEDCPLPVLKRGPYSLKRKFDHYQGLTIEPVEDPCYKDEKFTFCEDNIDFSKIKLLGQKCEHY